MTKLVENDVKTILAREGLQVPRGAVFSDGAAAGEFARELGGPVYVKAQVVAGDRAAVGAVVRVDDPADVADAASKVLGLVVGGQGVESVLVEEAVRAEWFGYAGVFVAEGPARQVLAFSPDGGQGFDPTRAPLQLDVEDAIYPHRLRKELARIGVRSEDLVALTRFLGAVVAIARRWSAYTLELNPVAWTGDGVVVIDAKADLDDYSKALIPDSTYLDEEDRDPRERAARRYQASDHRGSFRYVQMPVPSSPTKGLVATHSVGGGESMVVLDAIAAAGLTPSNYCDTSGAPSLEKVAAAAELVGGQDGIAGLFFSTCIANQPLSVTANGLIVGWDAAGWRGPTVVRFAGNQADVARDLIRAWAATNDVAAHVVGEETDEWAATELLASLLDAQSGGTR